MINDCRVSPSRVHSVPASCGEQTQARRPRLTLTSSVGIDRELSSFRISPMHGQTHPLDPMHSCLGLDEIVRLIACELVDSRDTATTVALACCCKTFEDPVLDTLWETQEKLLPLLKSLPGDIWNEGRCTVSASTTRVSSSLNCSI